MVGPNGSGKRNLLDGLRFLHGAALDDPLGDVLRGRWEGQREIWSPIRGSIVEAAHVGRTEFHLNTEWDIDGQLARHGISVSTASDASLIGESLGDEADRY